MICREDLGLMAVKFLFFLMTIVLLGITGVAIGRERPSTAPARIKDSRASGRPGMPVEHTHVGYVENWGNAPTKEPACLFSTIDA